MHNFRVHPPKEIGGSKVVVTKDYQSLKADDHGKEVELSMPETSNVLQWFTEDRTKVSVRPSGTEPKIKFYIEVKGKMADENEFDAADQAADAKIAAVRKSLNI